MLPDAAFLLSVALLLGVPGPTNTLLAASGAAAGVRRSLVLMPAELGGYLITIGLLTGIAGPWVAGHPALPVAFKLAAGLYIASSAVRLWSHGAALGGAGGGAVGPRRVFVTTLLNPKGLLFAFVIFPAGGLEARLPAFAAFSVEVLVIGFGWIVLGHLLARTAGAHASPRRISRSAALALGVFAAILLASAMGPLFSPAP